MVTELREVTILLLEAKAALGILCPALAILQLTEDVKKIQLRATKLAMVLWHMACRRGGGNWALQPGKEKPKGKLTAACSNMKGSYKH